MWSWCWSRIDGLGFGLETGKSRGVGNMIMAALYNRAGHYIFALWFLLLSFFPRLISAVADWMSTILPHMVWP